MFWIRSGLHSMSISDWLTAGPTVAAEQSTLLDDVRDAMLDALGAAGEKKRPLLEARIRTARDAHTLWALRTELMTVVAQLHGEGEARARLASVTTQFEGLLPLAARKRRTGGLAAAR